MGQMTECPSEKNKTGENNALTCYFKELREIRCRCLRKNWTGKKNLC